MSRRSGFTLIELLTVIAIIAVLAAILIPVFGRAKEGAKYASSMERCHQFYLALAMYRTDNDGDGKYGELAEMGLPTGTSIWFGILRGRPLPHFEGLTQPFFNSPCGWNYQFAKVPSMFQFQYMPDAGQPPFATDVAELKDQYPILVDFNCDDHSTPLFDKNFKHRGIGVLLGGQVVNKVRDGDVTKPKWWAKS